MTGQGQPDFKKSYGPPAICLLICLAILVGAMMMANAIVWWFTWVNVIGFFLFRRWFKKNKTVENLSLADLGISDTPESFCLHKNLLAKTALLAFVLFGFAYLSEHLLEQIFIVDYRFIFPLVGPGGMFVSFVINLFHIVGVLIVVIPLSTWLFQLTGKIYLGAMTSAALVSYMFASSLVIAPIPI